MREKGREREGGVRGGGEVVEREGSGGEGESEVVEREREGGGEGERKGGRKWRERERPVL